MSEEGGNQSKLVTYINELVNYKHVFFFVIIVLQMFIYNYPYLLKIEPRNLHAFRQYDCLSFAQGFYNNRGTLIEPCINNLGNTGTGKTASEFPIIQYFVGNIWKLTGISTLIYRLLNLLFLFAGLFSVYKLFYYEFKNKIFATLVSAFIFTSPILSFYGVSVISDIQAFSLSMIGFYFFYTWSQSKNSSHFILFLLLFSLAGLLKASSAVLYILCFIYYLITLYESTTLRLSLNSKTSVKILLLFVLPAIVWVLWYWYVQYYNQKNNGGFFLIGILPIWDMPKAEIIETMQSFIYNVLPSFFNPFILFLIFIVVTTSCYISFRKKHVATVMLLFCLFAFVGYVFTFFKALDRHDYYLINMTSVLILAFFFCFKITENVIFFNLRLSLFVLSLLIAVFTYTSSVKTWKKINFNVQGIGNALVFNAAEQKDFFWIYWLDRKEFHVLEDKTLNIEKLGITKFDTILTMGDFTINRSLYLLNRVGYTDYKKPTSQTAEFIKSHKSIKYIVTLNHWLESDSNLVPFFKNKIYQQDSLSIFKIKD